MRTDVVLRATGTWSKWWPPTGAHQFVCWLEAQIERIPPEYRPTAKIQIDAEQEYPESSCNPIITIFYERPENDDEYARRCEKEIDQRVQEAYRLKQQIASAQARLEELK